MHKYMVITDDEMFTFMAESMDEYVLDSVPRVRFWIQEKQVGSWVLANIKGWRELE